EAGDGGEGRGARRPARGRGDLRRLVVDGPDHAGRAREAARRGLRAAGTEGSHRPEARPASGECLPLSLLRLDADAAREHLRPDAVPLAPLLRELPPAVRAVQDDLARRSANAGSSAHMRSISARSTASTTPSVSARTRAVRMPSDDRSACSPTT